MWEYLGVHSSLGHPEPRPVQAFHLPSFHLPNFSPGNKGSVPRTTKIHTAGLSLKLEQYVAITKVVILTSGFYGMCVCGTSWYALEALLSVAFSDCVTY